MDAPKTTNRNEFRFVFYTDKYEETVAFYRDSTPDRAGAARDGMGLPPVLDPGSQ